MSKNNLWIFIDVESKNCLDRIKLRKRDDINKLSLDELNKHREFYLSQKEDFGFKVIDGNRGEKNVFDEIIELVLKIL